MRLRTRALACTAAGAVAITGLVSLGSIHALAGSGFSTVCNDNNPPAGWTGAYGVGDDIPLIGGPYGAGGSAAPITLGVEISTAGSLHVALCYSTSPYASTTGEATGGAIAVDLLNPPSWSNQGGNTAAASCNPDQNPQGAALACLVATKPTYSITPGSSGQSGDTITVNVPFTVCLGGCTSSGVSVNPTGVFVAQLVPAAEPGIGVGYQMGASQVWVDGLLVGAGPVGPTGAYVNPFGAIVQSLDFSQGGPCLVGVCVPKGYVETTGTPVAGIQLLGTSINVFVPKECIYTNPSGQCP
jgi:hypothetical protein